MSSFPDFEICISSEQYKDAVIELVAEYEYSTYQVEKARLSSPSEDPSGWASARSVALSMLRGCEIYVAIEDGSIVGFAAGNTDDDVLQYGYLHALYVQREHRHRGIGAALLKQMELYFAKHNCRKIRVILDVDDEEAIAFSQKAGYYKSYLAMKKCVDKMLLQDEDIWE